MRFGILGRTRILIQSARLLIRQGHTPTFVATSTTPSHDGTTFDEFSELATEHQVPFILSTSLNESMALVRGTNTDIAISINWPALVVEPLLSLFSHGILNAHAGDLPRYRGNAVANWVILNGEPRLGLSIHRMIAELDAGPILKKSYLNLSEQTYIADVYAWLEKEIPMLFGAALKEIADGKSQPIQQSTIGLTPLRVFPRKPEDGLIDWSKSDSEIHRLIRASSHPFSGAFTLTEQNVKITIWMADRFRPEFDFCAVPGQVCFATNGDPVIACGTGMLRLTDCTLEKGSDARPLILSSLRNRLG